MKATEARRIAENEAIFREVNERIADSAAAFAGRRADFVCECADPACTERIELRLEDYEAIRAESTRFVLAPDHDDERVEEIVEREGGHQVVEKTVDPLVTEIVRRLDPRTDP